MSSASERFLFRLVLCPFFFLLSRERVLVGIGTDRPTGKNYDLDSRDAARKFSSRSREEEAGVRSLKSSAIHDISDCVECDAESVEGHVLRRSPLAHLHDRNI